MTKALNGRIWTIAAFSALLIGCTVPVGNGTTKRCSPGVAVGQSEAGLEQIMLCISRGGKIRAFTVEVAKASAEQAKGMMFRTGLADDRGMLFPFTEQRVASFWMRNTVIPLDIIFIRADGTIESIAENTIPYSTDPVESGEPVAAVLELRSGLSTELGLAAGDKVTWQTP